MATCTFGLPKVLSTMSPYLQSRPNIPTIFEGASQKSSAVVREIPCLCVCYYYYYYCYYSKSLMKPNTYWVRNIVADALAKHRCHQFAIHVFRIQILILAVEQQSRSIWSHKVRERLADHCKAEHWPVLKMHTQTRRRKQKLQNRTGCVVLKVKTDSKP